MFDSDLVEPGGSLPFQLQSRLKFKVVDARAHTHTHAHTYKHKHKHAQTHTNTHKHTHTHTHTPKIPILVDHRQGLAHSIIFQFSNLSVFFQV